MKINLGDRVGTKDPRFFAMLGTVIGVTIDGDIDIEFSDQYARISWPKVMPPRETVEYCLGRIESERQAAAYAEGQAYRCEIRHIQTLVDKVAKLRAELGL